MQPLVLQLGYHAALLQTGVLVVDALYQGFIAPDDVDFGDGYAHIVEDDAL